MFFKKCKSYALYKIFLKIVISFIVFIVFINFNHILAKETNQILLFVGQGCPHCAKVEEYIKKNNLTEFVDIEIKEIYFNRKNAIEFNKICEEKGIPLHKRGVPLAIIDDEVIIGDNLIINALENKIKNIKSSQTQKEERKNLNEANLTLTLPLVIGAAIVDAINPCAFAVLIILITTILVSGLRKRVLKAGLAFSFSIFISYFLMGLGIYSAIASIKVSHIFIKIIGVLALLIGILNIKDYFKYGVGGFVIEVPQAWRPKMKTLITSVTSPLGAFFVGFLVSLFLLPCTSGPYIVILGMLGQKETFWSAFWYLILYNIIFILPMVLITLAVYKGLDPSKAEEIRKKRIKLLHLIAGIIMIIMGIILLSS